MVTELIREEPLELNYPKPTYKFLFEQISNKYHLNVCKKINLVYTLKFYNLYDKGERSIEWEYYVRDIKDNFREPFYSYYIDYEVVFDQELNKNLYEELINIKTSQEIKDIVKEVSISRNNKENEKKTTSNDETPIKKEKSSQNSSNEFEELIKEINLIQNELNNIDTNINNAQDIEELKEINISKYDTLKEEINYKKDVAGLDKTQKARVVYQRDVIIKLYNSIKKKYDKKYKKLNDVVELNKKLQEKNNKIDEESYSSIYCNNGLYIKKNKFNIYECKYEFQGAVIPFGFFNTIKRINYNYIDLRDYEREEHFLYIDNTKQVKKDNENYFKIERHNAKITEIFNYIKLDGVKHNFVADETMELYNFFLNDTTHINEVNKIKINAYGVYKNSVITPNDNIELILNDLDNKFKDSADYRDYLTIFEDSNFNINYNVEELYKTYYNYLNKSIRARITAQYSILNLFHRYIMKYKNADLMPYLTLYSHKGGTGKSTILRLNTNILLLNHKSEGLSSKNTHTSLQNIANYQYIDAPLVFDDIKKIGKDMSNYLKNYATSSSGYYVHTLSPNNSTISLNYLRLPFFSMNNIEEIEDSALLSRFLVFDYDNQEIKKKEFENLMSADEIAYLEDNLKYIAKDIWRSDYLTKCRDIIDNYKLETSRNKNLFTSLLKLSEVLLNELFKTHNLQLEEIEEAEYKKYISNAEDLIYNETDKFRSNFIEELIRVTTLRTRDYNYNIIEYINYKNKQIKDKKEKGTNDEKRIEEQYEKDIKARLHIAVMENYDLIFIPNNTLRTNFTNMKFKSAYPSQELSKLISSIEVATHNNMRGVYFKLNSEVNE